MQRNRSIQLLGHVLLAGLVVSILCAGIQRAGAQSSNLAVRIMSANISSGNYQSYETAGMNILKGLKPDIVAIQEFKYFTGSGGSTNQADIQTMVDEAFGPGFHFYKEVAPGFTIPNGIISRWPIVASGSWPDPIPTINDRSFAWAQIDLPGSNDLYVVSMHLYASGSATDRNTEAAAIKSNLFAHFPTNAWIVVGGDFNTGSRGEAAISTFKTFLSDAPIPADNNGDPDTNAGRSSPYDYLLPSFAMTNFLVPVVLSSHTFNNGLVFDSRVYTPLSDVSPVAAGDSGAFQMQHMAVIKDFLIPLGGTNATTNAPSIVTQPHSQTKEVGAPAEFTVSASGSPTLVYQWQFNGTNLPGANATNYLIASVQNSNAGNYAVIITNAAGSATSELATLTVAVPNTNASTYTGVLAGWDVSGQTNFGASPLVPTTNAPNLSVIGLTRGSGVTTNSTAASRAWGGNGFDSTAAESGVTAGDNATFSISAQAGFTVSFASLSRFDYRRSNSGPQHGVLQYQIGSGAFIDIAPLAYSTSTSSGASLTAIDLSSITDLQNVGPDTNVTFRIVNYGATSSGGTWYVNDVAGSSALDFALEGTVAPIAQPPGPSAIAPTLAAPMLSGTQFIFHLTGTAASNYVVQVSTNLADANWLSVQTNAAPFWFTNTVTLPRQFYRGIVAP